MIRFARRQSLLATPGVACMQWRCPSHPPRRRLSILAAPGLPPGDAATVESAPSLRRQAPSDVASVTSYHQDLRSWPEVAAVARELFGDEALRAWTPVGVAGLWMEGYLHEISALALL